MDAAYREQGLSEIIGFILLIAILMVALTVYFTYTVPAIGREGEINHMTTIKNDFVQYKIMMDSLWINDAEGVLVSTSVDLGTGGTASESGIFDAALLQPIASGGLISINQTTDTLNITGTGSSGAPAVAYHLGDVTYTSANRYWIDQDYLYQSGAVVLIQDEDAVVRASPPLCITRNTDGTANTTAVSLIVIQTHGNQILSGWGPVRIDTSYDSNSTQEASWSDLDTLTLKVESDDASHRAAWKRVFEDAVSRYSISPAWYTITDDGNSVSIVIAGANVISLDLKAVTFTATAQTALSMIT